MLCKAVFRVCFFLIVGCVSNVVLTTEQTYKPSIILTTNVKERNDPPLFRIKTVNG